MCEVAGVWTTHHHTRMWIDKQSNQGDEGGSKLNASIVTMTKLWQLKAQKFMLIKHENLPLRQPALSLVSSYFTSLSSSLYFGGASEKRWKMLLVINSLLTYAALFKPDLGLINISTRSC